jgi:hypothetical protein
MADAKTKVQDLTKARAAALEAAKRLVVEEERLSAKAAEIDPTDDKGITAVLRERGQLRERRELHQAQAATLTESIKALLPEANAETIRQLEAKREVARAKLAAAEEAAAKAALAARAALAAHSQTVAALAKELNQLTREARRAAGKPVSCCWVDGVSFASVGKDALRGAAAVLEMQDLRRSAAASMAWRKSA